MVEYLLNLIAERAFLGVALGVFIESVFPPVPSEVILGYAGFLVGQGTHGFAWLLLASVVGKVLSVAPIWWLGARYGHGFIVKYGDYIGYTAADYEKGRKLFARYGYGAVFVSQFLPFFRSIVSIPAGVLQTKFWPFMFWSTLGAALWNALLMYIGTQLGTRWERIDDYVGPFLQPLQYLVAASIVGFVGYQAHRIYRLRREKRASS